VAVEDRQAAPESKKLAAQTHIRAVTPPRLKLQIHSRTLEPPGQRRNEAVGVGLVVIDVG
jgi:hypothetical protein